MAARLAGLQGTLVRLSRDLSVQGTGWAWVSRRSGPSRRRPDWRHAHVCRVMATGSPGSLGDAHVSRVLTLDSGLNTRRTCAFSRSEPDGPLNTRLTCADSSAPGTSASSSVETSGPRRDSPCATLVEPSRGHAGRALSRPGDVVRAGSWARRCAASALRADPGRRGGVPLRAVPGLRWSSSVVSTLVEPCRDQATWCVLGPGLAAPRLPRCARTQDDGVGCHCARSQGLRWSSSVETRRRGACWVLGSPLRGCRAARGPRTTGGVRGARTTGGGAEPGRRGADPGRREGCVALRWSRRARPTRAAQLRTTQRAVGSGCLPHEGSTSGTSRRRATRT